MEKEAVEILTAQLILAPNTNNYGTIFGGKLVEIMDMTGALAAMRFASDEVVTASIETIDFRLPIKQGDLVEIASKVIYTGKTSMIVKVDAYKVRKFTGRKDFSCRGYFAFVSIDLNGRPKHIPSLKLVSEEDRKFWAIGEAIRKRSLERKAAEQ
ncbi:MAG: acyl-CoA thioesterase [Deltaproteobacteria bacterium]